MKTAGFTSVIAIGDNDNFLSINKGLAFLEMILYLHPLKRHNLNLS